MENVQYYHQRRYQYDEQLQDNTWKIHYNAKGGTTIALALSGLTLQFILLNLRAGGTVQLKLGRADCSKKDNYSRKMGAKIAEGRLQPVEFTVVDIIRDDTRNLLKLELENGGIKYTILCSQKGLRFVSVD